MRFKDMIQNAKQIQQAKQIRKDMEKLDFDQVKIDMKHKAEDMELMITNFEAMFPLIKSLYNKCFELSGKDSIRLDGEKIYKDKEFNKIEEVEYWFNDLKTRWEKQ